MEKQLHHRPDLNHLRKQAKALLAALTAGDPGAARTFSDHLPAARGMDPRALRDAGFRLADAQSALARKNGFASWPRLAEHVETLRGMEGVWEFESLEMDGHALAGHLFASSRILIDGDRFRMESPMAAYEGEFAIDVDRNPNQIDIEFVEGPEAGNWSYGLFALNGDRVTFCLGLTGAPRPTAFGTSEGSGHALETLRRVSDDRPAVVTGGQRPSERPAESWEPVTPGPEHERLQGTWKAVRIVSDGVTLPAPMLESAARIGEGARVTIQVMGSVILEADVRIDASVQPMQIDYRVTGPGGMRGIQKGILQWNGEAVTFCYAPPGAPRPTEFASPRGSGITLSTWTKSTSA